MNSFEYKVTSLIREYNKTYSLLCQRNIQSRFVTQYADIIIDCGSTKEYIAIECKSMKTKNFYFKRYFHSTQIETLSEYFKITGRSGFISIYENRIVSMIPWKMVLECYLLGYSEVLIANIRLHPFNKLIFEKMIHSSAQNFGSFCI